MRDLGDVELRALAFVDERELVRDLSELVAVPSVSGDDAESDVLHLLAKQLRDLDLDIDLWPLDLPALTADPDFPGWEVPRTEAWGLVATARDTPRRTATPPWCCRVTSTWCRPETSPGGRATRSPLGWWTVGCTVAGPST